MNFPRARTKSHSPWNICEINLSLWDLPGLDDYIHPDIPLMIPRYSHSNREVFKASISSISPDQYFLEDALVLSPAQTPSHGTGSLLLPQTGWALQPCLYLSSLPDQVLGTSEPLCFSRRFLCVLMRTALERAVLSCARHFVVTPSGSSMHITQRQVIDMDNLPPTHTHLHTHTF